MSPVHGVAWHAGDCDTLEVLHAAPPCRRSRRDGDRSPGLRRAACYDRGVEDFLVEISYDAADAILEDLVQARLFTTSCSGSSSVEEAGVATVSAYFPSAVDRDAAVVELRGIDGLELRAVEAERVDWLERYQQSLVPLFIGRRFVVAPDPSLIDRDTDRLRLVVPQEQAFGTGAHETTSLCVELLETIDVRRKLGLDIGTGSGILAMAMLRLGASKVIAFDNDADACGALRANRMRNEVAEAAMPVFIGSAGALRGGVFDVVTMNILPEVIVALLPGVAPRIADGGTLVLSGILAARCGEVVRVAAVHGLRLVDGREKGEWWAGAFRKV